MTNIELLKKYFGFDSFKDIQEPVINNLLRGNNTLCLMPTGGGKSIIYQVAGIQTGKMTIVISPLLALMKQQDIRLNDQGINTFSYNSSTGDLKTQYNKIRNLFKIDKLPQFLFVSPEKVLSDGYLEYLLKKHSSKIGLIVIDEAHCISQWGDTFRPAYKTIPHFIKNVFGDDSKPPILCLTATLNPNDRDEIVKDLNISEINIFKSTSLIRENLKLEICPEFDSNETKKIELEKILLKHKCQKMIVYTHLKDREYGTKEMSNHFKDRGFNCSYFDADIAEKEKLSVLEKFESGDTQIVFATSAFGMGIDIPDIRVVIHYLIPESIEQYYQEVGRAGRDGESAFAYLMYTATNFKIKRDLIKRSLLSKKRIQSIFDDTINVKASSYSRLKSKNESVFDSRYRIQQLGRTDIREDNSEMIIFLILLQYNHIDIKCKGVMFIDCFESNGVCSLFNQMSDASINQGIVKRIAKKLDRGVELVNFELYNLFNNQEINLTKNPSNVIYYTLNSDLNDDVIDLIYNELEARVKTRLAGFEKLIEFIQNDSDIDDKIAAHLGI